MAHSGFSIVAFLCFFLFFCLTSLANGILLAADEGTKKGYQNISIDSWISNLDEKIGVPKSTEVLHWAAITTKPGGSYFGAKATLNVYGLPSITNGKTSGVEIWIGNEQEIMRAGWHVAPDLYGDHQTHFFVHWTTDNYTKTGCYNFNCTGFVRDKTSSFVPGYIIRPLSTYNGDQYEITLKIQKNPDTENWELYRGRNADLPVGYWPKSLFKTLDGANHIEIGGTATFEKGKRLTSPPMGSGHYPFEGEGKAAYIKNIQFINTGYSMYTPDDDAIELNQDAYYCYYIDGSVRSRVYFGGGGHCSN